MSHKLAVEPKARFRILRETAAGESAVQAWREQNPDHAGNTAIAEFDRVYIAIHAVPSAWPETALRKERPTKG
jgi:hypothetical protein